MNDEAESAPDAAAAADVFSLLGSEDRLDILLTLGDATRATDVAAFPFNEFWNAVAIDDSGRFNYHLGELRGTFVEESEEGYRLTYPGALVYMLVRSGSLTERPVVDPQPTDVDCPDCGGTVTAGYEDQLVSADCADCGRHFTTLHAPPGCVDEGSGTRMLRAAHQYGLREVVALRDGVCPNCGGTATPTVVGGEDREADGPTAYYSCAGCNYFMHTGVAMPALVHPAAVSFFDDHGVDVLAGAAVEHALGFADGDGVAVEQRDPWRFAVAVTLDGERLRLVVDGDLDVVDHERRSVA